MTTITFDINDAQAAIAALSELARIGVLYEYAAQNGQRYFGPAAAYSGGAITNALASVSLEGQLAWSDNAAIVLQHAVGTFERNNATVVAAAASVVPSTPAREISCQRCGHEWASRVEKPRRCPSCFSTVWDKPRS